MTPSRNLILSASLIAATAASTPASAATLSYVFPRQITFAKDLIVNDDTTIYTPTGLQLKADGIDMANLATVDDGDVLQVKITLTDGARFDTTADATRVVGSFQQEDNVVVGGDVALAGYLVGTPYYSTTGQELNFRYRITGAGPARSYVLQINSMQITRLVQGLFTGNAVGAEITMQNAGGQQILAAKATIAKSKWGLEAQTLNSDDPAKKIDVGTCDDPAFGRREYFSPGPLAVVGGACIEAKATDTGRRYFNAGGIHLDIAKDTLTGTNTLAYINNFSAIDFDPEYNVVGTASITVTVTGSDLKAFEGGKVWLDRSAYCTVVNPVAGTVSADGSTATFIAPAPHPLWNNLAASPPDAAYAWVCFEAPGGRPMTPQQLSGRARVEYDLPTQRVDPPEMDFDMLPLRLNGTTLTFQNVNPAGNVRAQSFIRLTNHNDHDCPITLDAKDDEGAYTEDSDNTIAYTLPAQGSWTINSEGLEKGATGATGSFGDGVGRWYVRVTGECANLVGSALNRNLDTGVVTDLTAERDNDQNLYGR